MAVDYSFKPYDPHFRDIFLQEKDRILKILSFSPRIEHLGSTAVPNLGGKGIIDIFIVVEPNMLEQAKEEIAHAGYDPRPKEGNAKRFVFVKLAENQYGNLQRYHLHLCTTDSEDFHNNVLFCTYLKNHPESAKEYAEIKKKAAAKANQSKDVYMAIRRPFVEDIIQKAKAELS